MRIIVLIITLAIIAFLFVEYTGKTWWTTPEVAPEGIETPTDTVNYAQDATREFQLNNCLKICDISEEADQKECRANCQEDFGQ